MQRGKKREQYCFGVVFFLCQRLTMSDRWTKLTVVDRRCLHGRCQCDYRRSTYKIPSVVHGAVAPFTLPRRSKHSNASGIDSASNAVKLYTLRFRQKRAFRCMLRTARRWISMSYWCTCHTDRYCRPTSDNVGFVSLCRHCGPTFSADVWHGPMLSFVSTYTVYCW